MSKHLGALTGTAIAALAAALVLDLSLGTEGRRMIYLLGLLIITCLACFAAIIGMVQVLLRTIDMRVILECGCVAKTDTTEGGNCPVHGAQNIAAYDPVI